MIFRGKGAILVQACGEIRTIQASLIKQDIIKEDMVMKKFLAVMMAAVLCLAAFTACGDEAASDR